MSVAGPSEEEVTRVIECIEQAARACDAAGTRFVLMLIPSKETVLHEPTRESAAYDRVKQYTASLHISVLDLRPAFRAVQDPASLFYKTDAHWNQRGIQLAAEQIMAFVTAQ